MIYKILKFNFYLFKIEKNIVEIYLWIKDFSENIFYYFFYKYKFYIFKLTY